MIMPPNGNYLHLLSRACSAIAAAPTMAAALRPTLASIGESTNATLGHALVCSTDNILESTGIWHVANNDSPAGLLAFRLASEAREFADDEGIPGQWLWQDQPLWLVDLQQDERFLRKAEAAAARLQSGFVFPLRFGLRLVGALEFYYRTPYPRDDSLLHIMAQLETELGAFIGRRLSHDPLAAHDQWPQRIIEHAGEAFIGMDGSGRVTDWNKAAVAMFGWSKSAALGRLVSELIVPPQYRVAHDHGLQRYLTDRQSNVLGKRRELSAIDSSGREFPVQITRWSIQDEQRTYFYAFIDDISAQKAQETYLQEQLVRERQLEQQVFHDALTGLANRALLLDRLERLQLQRGDTWHGSAILFIDLDGFKKINDRHGHMVGDHVLIAFAGILADIARQMDTVARFAADAFVLVCDNVNSYDGAKAIAQRILDNTAAPCVVDEYHVTLSGSIGIVLANAGDDPKTLINAADTAMYRAKRAGGQRYAVFDRSMRLETTPLWRLETELKQAIESDQLRLHFQPIVGATERQVMGGEALIRWQHPDKGLLSPADFIPLAQDSGLIVPISHWVIRQACRCAQLWLANNSDAHATRYISINLSAKELEDPDIVTATQAAFAEFPFDTTRMRIGVEITESAIMHDPEGIIRRIQSLKDIGIWFGLDDFGTGYSSLAHLRNIPLDIIKVDRSFVSSIEHNRTDYAITSTVVKLAHSLGLAVVAEGVESDRQARILRKMGTDYLQGFRFGHAVPPHEFEPILWGTVR